MVSRKTDWSRSSSVPVNPTTGRMFSPRLDDGLIYYRYSDKGFVKRVFPHDTGVYWAAIDDATSTVLLTGVPGLSFSAERAEYFELTVNDMVVERRANQWYQKNKKEFLRSPYRQEQLTALR